MTGEGTDGMCFGAHIMDMCFGAHTHGSTGRCSTPLSYSAWMPSTSASSGRANRSTKLPYRPEPASNGPGRPEPPPTAHFVPRVRWNRETNGCVGLGGCVVRRRLALKLQRRGGPAKGGQSCATVPRSAFQKSLVRGIPNSAAVASKFLCEKRRNF